MAINVLTKKQASDIDEVLLNLHPGTHLREDYLPGFVPYGITRYKLAKMLHLTQSQFDDILSCRRNVTANLSLRLGKLFGQSPSFWLSLQNKFDLELAKRRYKEDVDKIVPLILPGVTDANPTGS
jgi:addiction module HigA family antidote